MNLETSAIVSSLKKKGFIHSGGGSHDKYVYHTKEGKKTSIFALISRGSSYKVYNDTLLSRMSKELKIKRQDLTNLVKCPLSQDGYEDLFKAQQII